MNENDTNTIHSNPEDDFISLADLIRMVWRHRLGIIGITLVVTIAVATFSLLSPRPFKATAMLEVIPEYTRDGRVDAVQFENSVLTQLESAKSAVVGMRVFKICSQLVVDLDFTDFMHKLTVVRPPKTSIISCAVELPSSESALAVASAWRDETLREVERKSMEKALIFVRGRLKDLQEDWLKHAAAVDAARLNAKQLEDQKLITVSRSVDDTALWQDLINSSASNDLQRMSDLQLKYQEMNLEFLDARNRLAEAEQKAAGAISSRVFYVKVISEIEKNLNKFNDLTPEETADSGESDELSGSAREYVKMLLSSKAVSPLGEPVVYRGARGTVKKTLFAGFAVFFIACFGAFIYEWARQVGLD